MTKITPNDVKKVAKLARIEIAEDELIKYSNQLEKILNYVAELGNYDDNRNSDRDYISASVTHSF